VIVCGGAGQFRMRSRAVLVHTERLVHKPAPATPEQHLTVEVTRADLTVAYGKQHGAPSCVA